MTDAIPRALTAGVILLCVVVHTHVSLVGSYQFWI